MKKITIKALANRATVHRHTAAKFLRGDITKMQHGIISRLESAYETLLKEKDPQNQNSGDTITSKLVSGEP